MEGTNGTGDGCVWEKVELGRRTREKEVMSKGAEEIFVPEFNHARLLCLARVWGYFRLFPLEG